MHRNNVWINDRFSHIFGHNFVNSGKLVSVVPLIYHATLFASI